MISVFVVCKTRLYRDGIAKIIQDEGADMSVVGIAADAVHELDRIRACWPDVLVADVGPEEGVTAMRAIVDALPETRVIALALPDAGPELILFAEAGIAGYVSRDDGTTEDLIAAVRSAANDEMICSPRAAATLLRRVSTLARQGGTARLDFHLTARQLEIVALVEAGLSNKEIARRLHIELPTVKNHLHTIYDKLDARGRTDAVARARAHGLMGPRSIPSLERT